MNLPGYDAWRLRSPDDERASFDPEPLELPPLCDLCPSCEGERSINDEGRRYRCPSCDGQGYVRIDGEMIEEGEAAANG